MSSGDKCISVDIFWANVFDPVVVVRKLSRQKFEDWIKYDGHSDNQVDMEHASMK